MQEHQLARGHLIATAGLGHLVEQVQPLVVPPEQLRLVADGCATPDALGKADMAFHGVHSAASFGSVGGTQSDVVEERLGRLGERHAVIGIHHVTVVVNPCLGHYPPPGGERAHLPRHCGLRRPANARAPSRASCDSSITRYAGKAPLRMTEYPVRMLVASV